MPTHNRRQVLGCVPMYSYEKYKYFTKFTVSALAAKTKSWNTSPIQYLFADSFPELGKILNAKLYLPSRSEEKMQICTKNGPSTMLH
jgi:hypothetical protein